jgi:hypothetical protein
MWVEAFIIYSITWGFGSIMNEEAKNELDTRLKARIANNKVDSA